MQNVQAVRRRGFNQHSANNIYLAIIFVILVFSYAIESFRQDNLDLENFWVNHVLILLKYALFYAVFIIFCRIHGLHGRAVAEEVGMTAKIGAKNVLIVSILSGLCIVGFMLVAFAFGELFMRFGYVSTDVPVSLRYDSFAKYLTCVVTVVLVPAIVEELVFRGIILRGLLRYGKVAAVISSAIMFCLFHLNPEQTVYQFVLGCVLGIIVLRTGNLVYAMIFHFVNNFAIITYTYIAGDIEGVVGWGAVIVLVTLALCVIASAMMWSLCKCLKRHDEVKHGKGKFLEFDNVGYFVGVAISMLLWGLIFGVGIS